MFQATRTELLFKARTKVFQLVYAACKKNAPVLAKEMYDSCNLAGGGREDLVGQWDGPKAFRQMLVRLNYKPTKMDKDFYTDAESVADGHVVLSRAVCDALGAEQGDRVFVRELREASLVTASRTREEAASSTAGVSVTGRLTNGAFASRREPRAAEPPPAPEGARRRRTRRCERAARATVAARCCRPAGRRSWRPASSARGSPRPR